MKHLVFTCLLLSSLTLHAQMHVAGDTLYGNEWIDYDLDYAKILIGEDGIYRVSVADAETAGLSLSGKSPDGLRLFTFGKEVQIFVSTDSKLTFTDFIEFHGKKNTVQLDSFLYRNSEDMLNPFFSNITDTTAYYLTWTDAPSERHIIGRKGNYDPSLDEVDGLSRRYVRSFSERVFKPYTLDNGLAVYRSDFVAQSGYSGNVVNQREEKIQLTGLDNTSNSDIELKVKFVSNHGAHLPDLKLDGETVISESLFGFQSPEYILNKPSTEVENDEVTLNLTGNLGSLDRYGLIYFDCIYPLKNELNLRFYNNLIIDKHQISRSISLIDNFAEGSIVIWDTETEERIIADPNNGTVQFSVAPGDKRTLFLSEESSIKNVIPKKVKFSQSSLHKESDYLIISHPNLYNDGSGNDFVSAYADYRSSSEGGSYKVHVFNVLDLYDEFSYGIPRSPLAIRNFAHYVKKHYENPSHIFLIGKGKEHYVVRSPAQLDLPVNDDFYIPTFGYPGSDNLMLANPGQSNPILPVGRIAVRTPEQLKIYLEKVIKYEEQRNLPQDLNSVGWKKEIMHLVGGKDSDQESLNLQMGKLKDAIIQTPLNPNVSTYVKNSGSPSPVSVTQAIYDKINSGALIMSFLGHSSNSSLDFNIDNPEFLENSPIFPILIALGCSSGNFHTGVASVGEIFCFYEDKGFLASIASSHYSYANQLIDITEKLYEEIGHAKNGQTLGQLLYETLKDKGGQRVLERQTQQYMLHGDPALWLAVPDGPDLFPDPSSVKTDPPVVDANLESFEFSFDIRNLGYNVDEPFVLKIEHRNPEGMLVQEIYDTLDVPSTSSSVSFSLITGGVESIGENRIYVHLDHANTIEEAPDPSAERNNELKVEEDRLGYPIFILSSTAEASYPADLSIVPDQEITLRASTSNAFEKSIRYRFELDTTELFNSPFKQAYETESTGGVLEWTPEIEWQDETVYYWRISPDASFSPLGYVWSSASFIHLKSYQPGWNQSHNYQWNRSIYDDKSLTESGMLNYGLGTISVNMESFNRSFYGNRDPQYIKEGKRIGKFDQRNFSMQVDVVVIDHITLDHWKNPGGGAFGSKNWRTGTVGFFAYSADQFESRKALINFLKDTIPDGHCVYVATQFQSEDFDLKTEEWAGDSLTLGTNLFQVLENEGAQLVRGLDQQENLPYLLVYKKGEFLLNEAIGDSTNHQLTMLQECTGFGLEGSMSSPLFGPSDQWDLAEYSMQNQSINGNDSFSVRLIGYDNRESTGVEIAAFEDITDTFIELSNIELPYIQFQLYSTNPVERIPAQIEYWRTGGQRSPDLALSSGGHLNIKNILQQGEPYELEFKIDNISNSDVLDSILFKLDLIYPNNQVQSFSWNLSPLNKLENTVVTLPIETSSLPVGTYRLSGIVNPERSIKERTFNNNFGIAEFSITSDVYPPYLDVTFDNRHIGNGEIISAKPKITVQLQDKNPFLAIDDVSHFDLKLTYPNGNQSSVYLQGADVEFNPSDPTNLNFSAFLDYYPEFDQDGIYTLEVEGRDASGNRNSALTYRISFRIVGESSLSHVQTWPNPNNGKFRFIYTLTGSEPVEYFKIDIFDAVGKHISRTEITGLIPGENMTAFEITSHDLPSGVYYYEVTAENKNGQSIPLYTPSQGTNYSDQQKFLVIRND